MQCENSFCVYWSNTGCILDEITLDLHGMCRECIYIDIDEKVLEQSRQKLLDSFQKRYLEQDMRESQ